MINSTTKYIEASSLPTPEEAKMAQKACCGRVCRLCESPAEYAWRRRTVDLALLVRDAVREDLSGTEREVVEKHWFDGRTLAAIAAETGKAPPNVTRTLARAHKKLYAVLRHTVKYQYNLESAAFAPLAVCKALAVAAASEQRPESPGGRIQALRQKENIASPLLAGILGIPADRLLKIEQDKASPGPQEIVMLAAFFNTTTDYLLTGCQRQPYERTKDEG